MINIAILGYGYWGCNLVRNLYKFSNCKISYIVDKDINKLKEANKLYPDLKCVLNPINAIKDKTVNAVVIALPASQHYKYAKLVLQNNKHLLIEKPATNSYKKLKELVNVAKKRKLQLMVDYTFLYTPAVRKIKELFDNNVIGDILFIESQRLNLRTFRKDVNVIWDLAVHDISIIQYLLEKKPRKVFVQCGAFFNSKIIDLAHITLEYRKNQVANIYSAWKNPVKKRNLVVYGTKKCIMYDSLKLNEKVKIYNLNNNNFFIPKLSQQEPLYKMCNEFLSCISNSKKALTNGDFALNVSAILDRLNDLI